MKTTVRFSLAALLVAAALALASSCGGAGGAASGDGGDGGMQSEDHGSAEHGGGGDETAGTDHSGMGHGSTGSSEEITRQMLEGEDGAYSDERFIDMMVPHHQGAVEMAEVALENAQREEIRQLSRDIVSTQEAEIRELKAIKQEEFGTSEVPMEMDDEHMEMMGMTDAGELAEERPFDKAFIDAMIPHHQSAIDMARVAREETENPRIRELSEEIIEAQRREISEMESWREEWYPEG